MATDMGQYNIDIKGNVPSQLVFNPIFNSGPLSQYFDFIQNVKNQKHPIGYIDRMGRILSSQTTGGFNPKGGLTIGQRSISTAPVKGETAQLMSVLDNTIYEQLLKTGTKKGDISGTLILSILTAEVRRSIQEQLMLVSLFGDKAYAGANADEIDFADGLFSVLGPQFVTANEMKHVDSQSGTALTSGQGIEFFRNMRKAAPAVLRGLPASQKVFLVGRNVVEQLQEDLETGVFGSSAFIQKVVGGEEYLTYNGIEIKEITMMEAWAEEFLTAIAGVTDNFNLGLLVERKNLTAGTNMMSDMNTIQGWYDINSQQYRTRNAFEIGFNIKHPSLAVIAW